MQLSQAILNRLGQWATSMYGETMEAVSWAHYVAQQPVLTVPDVPVRLKHLTHQELLDHQLEPGDMQLRVLVAALGFRPGRYDLITRTDGSAWRLVSGRDGTGHVWHVWIIRQLEGEM